MRTPRQLRVIAPDGTVTVQPMPSNQQKAYDLLTAAVGGYIERVPYTQNCWVNEEGLLKSLPPNRPGRDEAHKLIPKKYREAMNLAYPFYAGNVAIVEKTP